VAGRDVLGLRLAQLQTLGFLTLVFTGQATIYLVRCDGPLWSTPPSGYLAAGTTFALLAASLMGVYGVLMAAVPAWVVGALLLAIGVAMLVLDAIKVGVLRVTASASRARPGSGPPPRRE
jgi:H+-transporting ATPase